MGWLRRFIRPFVVVEESMTPTLLPGDGLIAVRWPRVRRGQLRVFRLPDSNTRRPNSDTPPGRPNPEPIWLIKRVGDIEPNIGGERFVALSDNRNASGVVDSSSFGLVDSATSMLVVYVRPSARSE